MTYKKECVKHYELTAQTSYERNKHYILGAKNIEEVIKESNKNPQVGYLLPNLTPELQIRFYWSAIQNIFEQIQWDYEDQEAGRATDRMIFDNSWKRLMSQDLEQFRVCVDTLTTVGYLAGEEARWLIYDTTLSGRKTHCYPAHEPLPNAFEAVVDDLQGLKQAFIEGREFGSLSDD